MTSSRARIRDRVAGNYGDRDGDMLIAQWQACIDFDVEAALPKCRVPIDVIGFSEDCQAPSPMGHRAAMLAPNARFHMLPGLGHLSCEVHKPEVVNAKIWEILSSHGLVNT